MKLNFLTLLMPLCVAAGWLLHSLLDRSRQKKRSSDRALEFAVSEDLGNLLAIRIILTELRNGQTNNAIMLLETLLDNKINFVWHVLQKNNIRGRRTAMTALKLIRDYRQALPGGAIPSAVDEETAEIHRQAQDILGKVAND